MLQQPRPVPIRTILVTIGLVQATVLALYLMYLLAHIEALLIIAAFFAVVLTPAVDLFRNKLHVSRGVATTVVFFVCLGLFGVLMYAFIRPLVEQTSHFADRFPQYLRDARAGEGPVGDLVKRYKLDERYDQNRDEIQRNIREVLQGSAVDVARRVFAGVVSVLTILVLAFLMILYGPDMLSGAVGMLSPPTRERVTAVARDCARALTGYVTGNLLISLIAGVTSYIALAVFGVPFRGVLALWVGFADLIPLVGATLGAIPAVVVAFLHSPTAGIAILIFFIVYQQFENHVLQVVIMSKTVQINQLFVLVSVLVGVELFGIIGALLAIPAAGVIQVIVRDLWDHRSGRPKDEPTVGVDEVPVSEATKDVGGNGDEAGEEARDGARDENGGKPQHSPASDSAPTTVGDS